MTDTTILGKSGGVIIIDDLDLDHLATLSTEERLAYLQRSEISEDNRVYLYKEREPQPESYAYALADYCRSLDGGPERLMMHESRRPPVRVGITHVLPEPAPLTKRQKRRNRGKSKEKTNA